MSVITGHMVVLEVKRLLGCFYASGLVVFLFWLFQGCVLDGYGLNITEI